MKKWNSVSTLLAAIFAGATLVIAQGQGPARSGRIIVPDSTVEHPEDIGIRAHTNHLIFLRSQFTGTSPTGETPGSLACVYATATTLTAGCPIATATALPSGGSQTIAIVDAFNYPTAESDLNTFSSQFGLPACTVANGCFKIVFATGTQPRNNCGWAQEASLDIEWAHAMAPSAKIVLVEAKTNSFSNLFQAVDVATNEVICGAASCPNGGTGDGEISMSWGGSEFSSEASNDSHFVHSGVVYFAASGDTGGANIYPSVSPDVVSAGGTSVNRNPMTGAFTSETAWSGSGGGPSKYESRPTYQDSIVSIVGTQRGAPDFSFDADPNTGVSVFDSTSCQGLSGWLVFGGTSVASPSLSGIVNLSGHFSSSSQMELTTIYSILGSPSYPSDFRDITSGSAGSFSAQTGWDFVTGVGSDHGTAGK